KLTEENARQIQQKIREEFVRIASFKDDSAELREFNDRFKNALTDYRRSLSKFVNTPPGFGFRSGGNGDGWLWQLRYLNNEAGFKKSVTLKPELTRVEAMLTGGKNFWRDYLAKWGYTTNLSYATVARPSQKLLGEEEAERKQRAAAEVQTLKARFSVADDQEAIRKYKAAYD